MARYGIAIVFSLLIAWGAGADPMRLPEDEAAISSCDTAAEAAARATTVPVEILKTIVRVETGRSQAGHLAPWPWALNIGGRGYWPETRLSALALLRRHLSTGARNVDIGCFQLNHRWHGDAFTTIEDMLDPGANAIYAARFLARLHAELGQWDAAIAAYHSRTPILGERYLARYRLVRAAIESAPIRQARRDPTPPRPPAPQALSAAGRPALISADPGSAQPFFTTGARPVLGAERP